VLNQVRNLHVGEGNFLSNLQISSQLAKVQEVLTRKGLFGHGEGLHSFIRRELKDVSNQSVK
jgi:hypothetical protein